jgi:spore coat protein U-like protein
VQSSSTISTTLLSFGTIDPAVSSTADATIVVTIPAQQPYTIAMNGGNGGFGGTRRMFGPGGSIPYKLFQPPPNQTAEWGDNGSGNTYPAGDPVSGIGTGSPQTYLVRGVTQPATGGVTSGSYQDQVQVTVNF